MDRHTDQSVMTRRIVARIPRSCQALGGPELFRQRKCVVTGADLAPPMALKNYLALLSAMAWGTAWLMNRSSKPANRVDV